ncbi:TetR/AcrR family transcriptional regulator [Mycolicibacterium sp. GF69]|uniref:TetR/AcrR family transcriptional regulator n=1 Tax=Mycolicibacterium sp. GF69 TaxID=2267251 RepID=UPI000DCC5EB3|nr:TetR/AcrR family transcriptional regulator [Mycolicibacterium sp. GF69]RAV10017.1 TetR/AcrR family transcriptional regulator [Mycolicibacterium sp. GF69]
MAGTDAKKPRQRADARRNIEAILDAALACLARDPDASVGDIARTAGVGRITLYGHFPTRADLVDAVFARTLAEAQQTLDAVDLTGDPRAALARLVASSWQIVNRHRALLQAAQRTIGPDRIRDQHKIPHRRVQGLIKRGRREGIFRDDLPTTWLVATFHNVLHGAAEELTAGRLNERAADIVIVATLLAAFTAPSQPVPDPRPWLPNAMRHQP